MLDYIPQKGHWQTKKILEKQNIYFTEGHTPELYKRLKESL
tara:strand:+ start:812 stop:934 length:123 start_codon:yes stop_codon:yes gene_type:complete